MSSDQNEGQPAVVEHFNLGSTSRRLDPVAISMGVEKDCPFRPGLKVCILPGASYNPRFRKAVNNAARAAAGRTEEEKETKFLSRYEDPAFVVEALVGDMGPITNGRGEAVPYTPEIGLRILSDPSNADVLNWISGEAHSYGQFYTEGVQADKGN